jgi:hypothetical protein
MLYRDFQCIHGQQCPIAALERNLLVEMQKMFRFQPEDMLYG